MLLAARVAVVLAQAPDFSGTWKLDPGRSRISAAASLAGLIAGGAPGILHITQPANGTLVVESQINEGHARLYKPGTTISTPVTVGAGGSITMTSRWQGRAMISEGARTTATGASSEVTKIREVIALSGDSETLTIEVTATGSDEKSTSTLTYTRTMDVGPCESWPTPCKRPQPQKPKLGSA